MSLSYGYGKVYGVDVYGSSALFQKIWPRLVRANAVEALMATDSTQSFKPSLGAATCGSQGAGLDAASLQPIPKATRAP